MLTRRLMSAAAIASLAGLACAQPTIDGVLSPSEEAAYGPIRWANDRPTGFGNNEAGNSFGAESVGNPADVRTGVEIAIPKAAIGSPNSFKLTGWINGGRSDFLSNQIIHDGGLPENFGFLGGPGGVNLSGITDADMNDINVWVDVDLTTIPNASGPIVADGSIDAEFADYTNVFIQTNFTGFGDNGDPSVQGGGGSEIDGVYIAQDATNIYIFVAGNVEANGNSLELFLDRDNASGQQTLSAATGGTEFDPMIEHPGNLRQNPDSFINNQSGLSFDSGFEADLMIAIDSANIAGDTDGNGDDVTARFPNLYIGEYDFFGDTWSVDYVGDVPGDRATDPMSGLLINPQPGYGAAAAGVLVNGDAGAPAGIAMGVNNSNTEGVIGQAVLPPSPAAPDDNWGYGSELNNLRGMIDTSDPSNPILRLFIGGNLEVNGNTLQLLFDVQPGGQNIIARDSMGMPLAPANPVIGFNDAANALGGLQLEEGFEADYLIQTNITNENLDILNNFADAVVLRTNGRIEDFFTEAVEDFSSFFGGVVETREEDAPMDEVELMDFSGPEVNAPDPVLGRREAEFAPRLLQANPATPIPGLLQIAIDNSNVDGIDGGSATFAQATAVSTGFELALNLDELGWDGSSDVRVAGWINNGGSNFLSNNVIGGLPFGFGNLGSPDSVVFPNFFGVSYVNISAPTTAPAPTADLGQITTAGNDIFANTCDSMFDTVIAIYDANGAIVSQNDDSGPANGGVCLTDGPSAFFQLGLPEGEYFLAVAGKGSEFTNGFELLNGMTTESGDYNLNIGEFVPAAAARNQSLMGTLAAGTVDLYRFTIGAPSTGPCSIADLDGNDIIDVFDLIAFLQNFNPNAACPGDAECAIADLDGNDAIDVFDLIAFLQNFDPNDPNCQG